MENSDFPTYEPTAANVPVQPAPVRAPFSKFAIWGFVLSCVSVFIFGFLGVPGVLLSARAVRATRDGLQRGRGLAIAGMIVGTVAFCFYVFTVVVRF